ncbi:MAG: FxsA family protein [Acidimicrobiia bacterium]|nr:FxsA family protein [Acidimicrobiia bacterium]
MPLMVLFLIVAVAELAVFVLVEAQIGLLNALLIAVATAVIGSSLVRRAGVKVIGDIRRRTSQGQLPGRELTHGAAILVSGALLISPGFLTDVIGFLLLVPPIRDSIHNRVRSSLESRITVIGPGMTADSRQSTPDIIDVEGWEES